MLKKSILRKVVAMLTMTAMTLVIVVPAFAQGSATEQYASDEGTIRGTITEISDSEVFVEEDPSDPIAPTPTTPPTPPDTEKGFFRVTGETEIFDQRGAEQVPATFEDLEVGQLVEATYVGPALVAPYPQQGTADSIVILEGPTDPTKPDPSEPGPPPNEEFATFSYELAVECEPLASATFFGFIPAEGGFSTPLTDTDGDGLYTGSVDVPQFPPGPRPVPPDMEPVSLPVQILQGTGTMGPEGNRPGLPTRVIKDFGVVKAEDTNFTASVSFCDGNGTTIPNGSGSAGDQYGGLDTNSDSTGGIVDVLPDTGGTPLLVFSFGVLLVGGGLVVRKVLW